jgi:hypothetical protein
MKHSEIDPAALLGAVFAAGLVLMIEKGPFGWLSSVGGIMLLLVIFAYDSESTRTRFQSVAFSAVAAFCVLLATAVIPEWLLGGLKEQESAVPQRLLIGIWVSATVVLTLVDRWKLRRRGRRRGV